MKAKPQDLIVYIAAAVLVVTAAAYHCKTACKTFQISGVISVQKLPPWVV